MPLTLLKKQPAAVSQPHVDALRANLKAITDLRAQVMAIVEKDRLAAADIASADATAGRIQTIQEAIDTARAEATYNGDPTPDLEHLEKQLSEAQQLHKTQSDRARAAVRIRERYSADMAALNALMNAHVAKTERLKWTALREDVLAGLAAEFLQKEREFLDIHRRVFGAAIACDKIAVEQGLGQFVRFGNYQDTWIGRPEHEAFWPDGMPLPEAAHAKQKEYVISIVLESDLLPNRMIRDAAEG